MEKVITACRVCGSEDLKLIFDLGNQVMTGVFPSTRDMKITSGPVELVKCSGEGRCGLVQLKQSYDLAEMYGMNYGYRTGLNASMAKHIEDKMQAILSSCSLQPGDLIIDIGSNDATGLKAYPQDIYELVGVDPSGAKFAEYYPRSVSLIPKFFSADVIREKYGEKKAKVITSFSMFYDLEDPVQFAKEVSSILDEGGVWVFEQSYLPAMLEANSFDTICHEHLDFYALKQIVYILDCAEMRVIDVEFNDINGGSFSVSAVKKESSRCSNIEKINNILNHEISLGLEDLDCYKRFVGRVEAGKAELIEFLQKVKNEGKKVAGLGASTKGNVLLQYYGINEDLLPMIGDVNPDKHGSFTPGTLIPITSEEQVLNSNPDFLLILPWHFKKFFESNPKMSGRTLVFPLPMLTFADV